MASDGSSGLPKSELLSESLACASCSTRNSSCATAPHCRSMFTLVSSSRSSAGSTLDGVAVCVLPDGVQGSGPARRGGDDGDRAVVGATPVAASAKSCALLFTVSAQPATIAFSEAAATEKILDGWADNAAALAVRKSKLVCKLSPTEPNSCTDTTSAPSTRRLALCAVNSRPPIATNFASCSWRVPFLLTSTTMSAIVPCTSAFTLRAGVSRSFATAASTASADTDGAPSRSKCRRTCSAFLPLAPGRMKCRGSILRSVSSSRYSFSRSSVIPTASSAELTPHSLMKW
mmetsp:Transcript_14883/g.35019  ORF Transcript_14883/g.35019 Transcript_14883/m.35019 type:complete len:289 (+) Transcript_14883:3466-4332(+)